jgi:hypothetical protein
LSSANASSAPRRRELLVELLEHVGCGGVDVGDRLGRDDHPTDGKRGLADERHHTLAERVGVGEEERRVPPEEQEPRHGDAFGYLRMSW